MQRSPTTTCRSRITRRERRASSACVSPRFGRRPGDDQSGGPFWARDSIYGPEYTGQPRKQWTFGASHRDPAADISPGNTIFSIPKTTRLKIVVSRVRVPVSPSHNYLEKPDFLSGEGRIGSSWCAPCLYLPLSRASDMPIVPLRLPADRRPMGCRRIAEATRPFKKGVRLRVGRPRLCESRSR
jgi:hypothetical protein